MVRRLALLFALMAIAAAAGTAAFASGTGLFGTGISPSRMVFDTEVDCQELLPDGASIKGVTDTGQDVSLDVLVLLDAFDQSRAERIMAKAAQSFVPLGITLKATYRPVSFASRDTFDLIEAARSSLGGQRPAGVDVVHVLTSKAIQAGSNTAVAGMADCIGGVKHPARAFSVSEGAIADWYLGVAVSLDGAGRTVAHEIGHLLGAHHHYANCVEAASAVAQLRATPCTLMFNTVDFATERLSTLNGTVVRQHAVDYATP